MDKPKDFADIVALIGFEDVGPIPAIGYTVTQGAKTVFFVKLNRSYVDWDRVVAWKYLIDLWPDYLTQEEDK